MPYVGELDLYRRQHRDLLSAASRLRAQADLGSVVDSGGTGALRADLAALSGLLMVHLQLEDRHLYPALLASQDAGLRATAARFHASLGTLRASAQAFSRHWLRPAAIEASPAAFSAELRDLLHVVMERIASEDAELFPQVER